jgi:hypothetical protein
MDMSLKKQLKILGKTHKRTYSRSWVNSGTINQWKWGYDIS